MKNLSAFIAGLIFAIGLALSGMTQPQKVIGFLDVFGDWDPSLIFVMVGAILVHAVSYQMNRRRATPLFEKEFHAPSESKIDRRLLIGAWIFGIGWGVGGFCPGPAIVSLASFQTRPFVFVVAMVAGMFIFEIWSKLEKRARR